MKVTKSYLKQVIKEELTKLEGYEADVEVPGNFIDDEGALESTLDRFTVSIDDDQIVGAVDQSGNEVELTSDLIEKLIAALKKRNTDRYGD